MNRRKFIQFGLATGTMAASGCSVIGKQMAVQDLPDQLTVTAPGTSHPTNWKSDPHIGPRGDTLV